jgi:O-6-methylguanine DNA methyltransferase
MDERINYRCCLSELGTLLLGASGTGIRSVTFLDGEVTLFDYLAQHTELKNIGNQDHPLLLELESQIEEYFKGERTVFSLPLDLVGTDFQKKVWTELLKIPFGKAISYKVLSEQMGIPKAIRAIAAANGANPLPIVVPCHRVIGSGGKLVGYSGGLWRKQLLLELENRTSPVLFR